MNMQSFRDPDLTSSRVLIVDDQHSIVTLLRRLLDSAGFENHVSTTDPREFLPLYRSSQPDLILLDLQMPHMDGFALMEKLAAELPPQTYLPVLVLTGDVTPAAKVRALSSGASDFLNKPLDPAEVILRMRNLLRTRWLHTELQRHNEKLEKRVRERTQQLADAQTEILERLALAAEYRDDATGQHTQRVGTLAELIARRLGLREDYIGTLRIAATLHDVGKIGVPDQVLMKPGKLTPEEFASVQLHARIGAAILGNSRFPVLQTAGEIAVSHHERWDGSGYPFGLSKSAIPLSGRIVAVADVFDALIHDRPYKKAWPLRDAIAELRRLRGNHLDPQCVDALVGALEADGLPWLAEAGRRRGCAALDVLTESLNTPMTGAA